jgi:hypothetical protein
MLVAILVAGVLSGLVLPAGQTAAQADPPATVSIGRVTLAAGPGVNIDLQAIADANGSAVVDAWPQLTALFGTEPRTPLTITFVNQTNPEMLAGMRWVTDSAWVAPDGASAYVLAEPFLALTPIEAGNLLRNLTSRGFIWTASAGRIPPGLLDGIARYVELPLVAQQARLGSLVQGLDQNGTLPPWDLILGGAAPGLSAEERTATGYAVTAFVADRYGVAKLRDLVTGFATVPDWRQNTKAVLGQDEAGLTAAWEQFLPRWFASGWRQNQVSAFDLTRAQSLFDRGAYEAAAAEAERSQRLFTDLGDEAGLGQVETLLAMCAVGLQADSVMTEVQAALENHQYEVALDLLANAEDLYALLPEAHRPGGTIDQYRTIAETGLAAQADLAEAQRLQSDWLQVTTARDHAVAAGDAFAWLADPDGVEAAQEVTSAIDLRIQRMVFVLSALVVMLAAWLVTWLWLHAPGRLQWPHRDLLRRASRAEQGGD